MTMPSYLPLLLLLSLALLGYGVKRTGKESLKSRIAFMETFQSEFASFSGELLKEGIRNETHCRRLQEKLPALMEELDRKTPSVGGKEAKYFPGKILEAFSAAASEPPAPAQRAKLEKQAAGLDELLAIETGIRKNTLAAIERHLYNAPACLTEGIKWMLRLPAEILFFLRLIPESSADRLKYNAFISIASGLIALFGLAASLLILFTGWENFLKMIAF